MIRAVWEKELPQKPRLDGPGGEDLWKLCLRSWELETERRITADEAYEQLKILDYWSYVNNHESLKYVRQRDILEVFPDEIDGGYATVRKARLRGEDGAEKLVALKTLKHGLSDGPGDNQSHLLKVSLSLPLSGISPKLRYR